MTERKLNKRHFMMTPFLGLAALTAQMAHAEEAAAEASSIEELVQDVFAGGKFGLDYRVRYESFETPATELDGVSHRVRYGYTTPDFHGFTAMIEGETVSEIIEDYHPADVAGTGSDLNQLWAQYAHAGVGKAKVGRQVYTLDDHRFIGHVGWRQNIQTFDAATASLTAIDNVTVNGFFLNRVNNVAGAHIDVEAYGVNVKAALDPAIQLTGFYYDIAESDVVAWESQTVGARANGAAKLGSFGVKYAASVAFQNFEGDEALYYAADLSTGIMDSGVTVGGGLEVMEEGFRTPLATLHKFNGFADKFLGASAGGLGLGLEDYYAYAGYKIPVGNGIAAKVVYHIFNPTTGGGEGGTELDLVVSYPVNKHFTLLGKYGSYQSDSDALGYFAGDKDMLTLELNFKY